MECTETIFFFFGSLEWIEVFIASRTVCEINFDPVFPFLANGDRQGTHLKRNIRSQLRGQQGHSICTSVQEIFENRGRKVYGDRVIAEKGD